LAVQIRRFLRSLARSVVTASGAFGTVDACRTRSSFIISTTRGRSFARPIAKAIASRALSTIVRPQLVQHLDFLEAQLDRSEWFAGAELTGADIQMSYPVEAALARAALEGSRPRLWSYRERIHARPAYQRALAKGGPFAIPK
jgi:glutathione S-transferase